MKKTFKIENRDCPVCAGKIEDGIKMIDGVESAAVSFLAGKIVIEAAEDIMDEVVKKALDVCKKIEPESVVTEK